MTLRPIHELELTSGVSQVAIGVEKLVTDTTEELRNFRDEQSKLRAQITSVLEDNKRLTHELAKYKSALRPDANNDILERLDCTNEALDEARKQIDVLQKDRQSLKAMQEYGQVTIANLEAELKNYRTQLGQNDQLIKQKFTDTIKILETKLKQQHGQLKTQNELIKALHEHKQRNGEQLVQLQERDRRKAKEQAYEAAMNKDHKCKLESMERQIKDFEKTVLYTRTLLDESTKREAIAMRKVHDALLLTEAAVEEKKEAEQRANTYKEEATQLATNIGNIMDEAAKRVDNEVTVLRTKLIEKDRALGEMRQRFKEELVHNQTVVNDLESRIKRLDQKYRLALRQNDKLVVELQSSSKRLTEVEQGGYQSATQKFEMQKATIKQRYECQLDRYINSHKQMKMRYKDALADLTEKFELEIYRLKKENNELLADNEMLRQAGGDNSSAPAKQ